MTLDEELECCRALLRQIRSMYGNKELNRRITEGLNSEWRNDVFYPKYQPEFLNIKVTYE